MATPPPPGTGSERRLTLREAAELLCAPEEVVRVMVSRGGLHRRPGPQGHVVSPGDLAASLRRAGLQADLRPVHAWATRVLKHLKDPPELADHGLPRGLQMVLRFEAQTTLECLHQCRHGHVARHVYSSLVAIQGHERCTGRLDPRLRAVLMPEVTEVFSDGLEQGG